MKKFFTFLGFSLASLTASADKLVYQCVDDYAHPELKSNAVYQLTIKTNGNGIWNSAWGSKLTGNSPGSFEINNFSMYFCKERSNKFLRMGSGYYRTSTTDCYNNIPHILSRRENDFLWPLLDVQVYKTEEGVFVQFDVAALFEQTFTFKCDPI